MKYVPDPDRPRDLAPPEVRAHFAAYREYLASVKAHMPASAFAFASADWHYDATQHECPHDAWVESLTVRENASGARSEIRATEIEVVLLGAYHDGFLRLVYRGVANYSLSLPDRQHEARRGIAHGDWLIDEVRLSERGTVIHEIAFDSGARWVIECADLSSTWESRTSEVTLTH